MSGPKCTGCGDTRLVVEPDRATGRAVGNLCDCAAECPDCEGTGWIEIKGEGRSCSVGACPCRQIASRAGLVTAANIPNRFASSTLAAFEARLHHHAHLVAALRRWVEAFDGDSPSLLFVGGTGLGKTHLAVALLRALIVHRNVRGRFVEFYELLSDIRASFGKPGAEQALLKGLVAQPILVVDELGKGRGNDFEQGVLDHLVGTRYNQGSPTIFTTNYPPDAAVPVEGPNDSNPYGELAHLPADFCGATLRGQVGDRLYSRILGMSKVFVLRGAGDYRARHWDPEEGQS